MKLGENFADIETVEFTGFQEPEAKGYSFTTLDVELTESKAKPDKPSQPMIVFHLDINEGEHAGAFKNFPKRVYQTYGNEKSLGRLKGILKAYAEQNPGVFVGNPFANGEFDEQLLINCTIGGVLRYDKNKPQYMNVSYLTTVEKALEAPVQEKPAVTQGVAGPATVTDDGDSLPF